MFGGPSFGMSNPLLQCNRFSHLNEDTLVPHANCGLGSWVKRQQVQYTLYTKGGVRVMIFGLL
eukprot:scaffold11144_cov133-Skeletonema_marinoi.AAC.4